MKDFPVPVLDDVAPLKSNGDMPLGSEIGKARESTKILPKGTDSRGGETICGNCGCYLSRCNGNCIFDDLPNRGF